MQREIILCRFTGRFRLTLAMVCSMMLAGCSTIKTGAIESGSADPANGLVYYLPIRTLDIEAKFSIQDCGLDNGKAVLKYDLSPTVTSAIAADRSHPYVISSGLDGKILKAMNFEISQYENGTLKGVNVIADDRTAETATNIISGAAKIALGLTGIPFSADAQKPNAVWLTRLDPANAADKAQITAIRAVCGAQVTDAVLEVQKLKKSLSGAREAAETKTKVAAAVTEAEKSVVDARASLKAANEAKGDEDIAQAREALATAVKALTEARKAAGAVPSATPVTSISQEIAAIIQRNLTFTATKFLIPPEAPDVMNERLEVSSDNLIAGGISGAEEALVAAIVLRPLAPPPASDEAVITYGSAAHDTAAKDGLWWRAPSSASLRICVKNCDDTTATRISQIIPVPQWGQLARLSLKNKVFAKNTTKIAFAPDGSLLTLSADATSAAERGSAAFLQTGETFLDFSTKRRTLINELAASENASEKAAIQQKLDVLDLQQKLAAAQSTVGPERAAQLALVQNQIDQTNKQIELLEVQAKLKKLQAEAAQ